MSDAFEPDEPGEPKTKVSAHRHLRSGQGPRKASLIVLSGKTGVGRTFKLNDGETVIGRQQDNGVSLTGQGVSRRHARITVHPSGVVELEDLGSTNGTWVEGQRIERCVLSDGQKFQVGSSTVLKFTFQDALDERAQSELYQAATRDPLTGIFNKKYFLEALAEALELARRTGSELALIMLDADHFKRVNDTWGHPAGDAVLQQLAGMVSEVAGGAGLAARYGGEEFVVMLPGAGVGGARVLAEHLRRRVARTAFRVGERTLPITVSVGVAELEVGMGVPAALMDRADQRLLRAKELGRNQVVWRG
jgi:two-component system, cell cycle response regulator